RIPRDKYPHLGTACAFALVPVHHLVAEPRGLAVYSERIRQGIRLFCGPAHGAITGMTLNTGQAAPIPRAACWLFGYLVGKDYSMIFTLAACRPLGPSSTENSTFWPSFKRR